jgi:hypothetical protein
MGRQRNFSRGHRSYLSLSLSLSRETLRESEVRHRVLWGNRFFFSCTRHVSMHLRRGIVIHSFIHSFCPRVVNPCSGLGGLEGQQKMSVILSVRPSVCLSVPGSLARVASPQSSVPSPFLFPPELSWWAGVACSRGTYAFVAYATVLLARCPEKRSARQV